MLLLGFIIALLTGCGSSAPVTSHTPTIITTFSVLADIAQAIAGDTATVTSLVPINGDAHVFEPTPANGVALVNATAVIELGVGFEPWFADLYAASGSNATRITASNGVTPLQAGAEVDPHIWHDVANAIIMAQAIRDGLITAMPSQHAVISANAAAYIAQLQALDNAIQTQLATIPAAQRKLVTSHDTFSYFAARYGFVIVGTGLGSVTTESSDPGASSLIRLITDIRASGVPAIFVENMSKPVIAAVNGFALGGGLELAMSCHIRVASDNAKMGLPEVSLGVIPGYGGTQRLTQLVGKGKAMEMIATAGMIPAVDALQWGLVNYVVAQPELIGKCEEIASKIAKNSPSAIASAYRSILAGLQPNAVGFEAEIKEFGQCFGTADFTEGTTAFLEKRKPSFTGK
jgi:ABC-type Zn uptake system ZnuABC Zn-binding protein ZnuA